MESKRGKLLIFLLIILVSRSLENEYADQKNHSHGNSQTVSSMSPGFPTRKHSHRAPTCSPPPHGGTGCNCGPTPPSHRGGSGSTTPPSCGSRSGSSTPPSQGRGIGITTPPSQGSGSGSTSPPSNGDGCSNISPPPTPVITTPPSSDGSYYNSPPPLVASPPPLGINTPPSPLFTSPPSPTTPIISTPPFIPIDPNAPGTVYFWMINPNLIWGILGYWGTIGNLFGTQNSMPFGRNLNILEALANARTDGYGMLYREGTASLLNSLVYKNFAYSTQGVKQAFTSALVMEKTASDQARLFKLANDGHLRKR